MKKNILYLMILCLISGFAFPISSFSGSSQVYLQNLSPEIAVIDLEGHETLETETLIKELERFTNLQEVLLYDWLLHEADMAAYTQAYPEVFFGFSIQIAEHNLRTDMTAFSTLHNNKSPKHTSLDFDVLRYCTRLEGLDLGHNDITDISFIENLTEIKVLILALNQIEDISVLSKLENLEYLEIFRNKIRDISPLAGLTNLLDINLGYNYISDYTPLYALKNLERLWLYQSNGYSAGPMKRATLRDIQEQLPNSLINGVSAGTGGGWREHPRYDTIFDIFKSSVYKPFDAVE